MAPAARTFRAGAMPLAPATVSACGELLSMQGCQDWHLLQLVYSAGDANGDSKLPPDHGICSHVGRPPAHHAEGGISLSVSGRSRRSTEAGAASISDKYLRLRSRDRRRREMISRARYPQPSPAMKTSRKAIGTKLPVGPAVPKGLR